jgi:S-DNA-T family DNA segregation ATPase FtsK/SpoIIIE
MANHLYSDRQRAALRDLTQLCGERARAEAESKEQFATRNQAAERELQETQRSIHALTGSELAAAQNAFQETTRIVTQRVHQEHGSLSMEYVNTKQKTEEVFAHDREQTEAEFKEAQWTITTVYESDKKVAKDTLVALQRAVGVAMQEIEAAQSAANELLARWDLAPLAQHDPAAAAPPTKDLVPAIQQCAADAKQQLAQMSAFTLPNYLKKRWILSLSIGAWLVLIAPGFLLSQWYYWLAAVTLLVPLVAYMLRARLASKVRTQAAELVRPLRQAAVDAPTYRDPCLEQAMTVHAEQMSAAKQRQNETLGMARRKFTARVQEINQRRERELRAADEKYPARLEELAKRRDRDLRQAEEKHREAKEKWTARREDDLAQTAQKHAQLLEASNRQYEQDWQQLTNRWETGLKSFLTTMQEIEKDSSRLFPAWSNPAWKAWQAAVKVPQGIRFGEIQVGLDRIPHGVPRDPRLRKFKELPLSALLGFPERGALLLKASGEGRTAAVQTLQAVMLRCLTAMPPGQVRFTIFDPVGLGENFAAFGHLADYVESLVTSRIWTETVHIEQRLADVTANIENVIQQFLRNQFQTLQEYNEQAGEVAEPYRMVVVANFPVNFSADAARRLVSIASSGARCGIHTLISVDMNQPLPEGFQLADLERTATTLVWNEKKFVWNDSTYNRFPLQLETPPAEEATTALLQAVGEQAKAAGRVEVPFDLLAPPPEKRWTADSRGGIRVPLGRAGALKQQYLQLGQGTAQHVLIAGKTGSGKSTLLHALITQLALFYSPDEVELYLVDFKKGVEFKTYAVHELPHARVIAVESEREFGLSVLQRLDVELKVRGELYRAAGVNDLNSYRDQTGKTLPRVLLIVDEFQEFFVEDDKVAQETALFLDRLVRQGRAFGVHILLGSQTLGGAYSLARSTIDQMAVRIALQCSETDGHLILSKENGAARLLERPGEAIYNDANGRVEGNHLFQTVWLSDAQHEKALTDVRDLARQRNHVPTRSQIIFEGTAPAELSKNPLLGRLLENHTAPAAAGEWVAWLGEAIAIKDPTAAVFRRQSGANLLLIGQHGEAAAHVLTSALLSLAAHQPLMDAGKTDNGLRFSVLGGLAADAGLDGASDQLLQGLPASVRVGGVRELSAIIGDLAQEVDRRHKAGEMTAPPQFLLINGLQRFRDLRKQEDDFSFSRRGDAAGRPGRGRLHPGVVRHVE